MKLVLMASNNGHLLDELIDNVVLIITDKPNAPIIKRAIQEGIPLKIVNNNDELEFTLKSVSFNHIIMCGYLKILPKSITDSYSIFNTHPSLLPNYSGMYGRNIHEAVLKNGDKLTGISLHKVNDIVDGGEIVSSGTVDVLPDDTITTLEKRVKEKEKIVVKDYFESLRSA